MDDFSWGELGCLSKTRSCFLLTNNPFLRSKLSKHVMSQMASHLGTWMSLKGPPGKKKHQRDGSGDTYLTLTFPYVASKKNWRDIIRFFLFIRFCNVSMSRATTILHFQVFGMCMTSCLPSKQLTLPLPTPPQNLTKIPKMMLLMLLFSSIVCPASKNGRHFGGEISSFFSLQKLHLHRCQLLSQLIILLLCQTACLSDGSNVLRLALGIRVF